MWATYNRAQARAGLGQELDLLVVGAGITGAGVLREAARLGLKAGLVEKNDFAWGTSSWSSKMVHGGLRYLRQGDIRLTLDAVRERQAMLYQAPGLVQPLCFLLPVYSKNPASRGFIRLGLALYDALAGQWQHKRLSAREVLELAPDIQNKGLQGGYLFKDALTDDTRLVFSVLQEALADGAWALNYARAQELCWHKGQVCGLLVQDRIQQDELQIKAKTVVNACGAWAQELSTQAGQSLRLRPLRGSHLVFSRPDFYFPCAVIFAHPRDKRPVFAFPFQGRTILGTTDLDHDQELWDLPRISAGEFEYLLEGARKMFPDLRLAPEDVLSSFSGIRPIISKGHKNSPSRESRRHHVWSHKGLITVSGGKLTTFRLIALDVLAAVQEYLGPLPLSRNLRIFSPLAWQPRHDYALDPGRLEYIKSKYRLDAPSFLEQAQTKELKPVFASGPLWSELRWAAQKEAVCRLEDLLLRRSRLGILCAQGGQSLLPEIQTICMQELGWDQQTWQQEKSAYLRLWQDYYSPEGIL